MVTLGVSDMARSVTFYQEGLGLPRRESSPEVAFFELNGTWLGLFGHDALAEDANTSPESNGFRGVTLAHNVGSPEAVDETLTQALAAGANLSKPAETTSWGGYSGYFADPDGHLWEVAYNPHFWIGPEDD